MLPAYSEYVEAAPDRRRVSALAASTVPRLPASAACRTSFMSPAGWRHSVVMHNGTIVAMYEMRERHARQDAKEGRCVAMFVYRSQTVT